MRAILVGAGGMGQAWARNLKDHDVTIAAWVDLRPEAVREAAEKHEVTPDYVGSDLREAIQKANADFVVDVTIPEAHCEVTVTALGEGLPVIGEKPMASSMAEARRMIEASERAGKLYMVSQSRRYDQGLRGFKKLIQEQLGGLGILNADFYIGAHFGGFRDEMPSPLVLDMAIHTFDEARYLSDADPLYVYAEEFNPGWSWYKGDACASAIFEMSNGLRFTYRGSWCAEGLHTSWDGDWRAVGPNGSAIWEKNGKPYASIVSDRGGFHSTMRHVEG
ncbi:MAG TPA: Gfo/Idh/MocA family oxidoreductase, partial [Fimbriimonas sp.]